MKGICAFCGKDVDNHTRKEKDHCVEKALAIMPEQQAELFRRQMEIMDKSLRRNTRSIYCLLGILGSMLTLVIQDGLTIPSVTKAYVLFLKSMNPNDFWAALHIYSFDPYYISWIIPAILLVTCWLSYRKLNPSEKDIMKRALTGDLR